MNFNFNSIGSNLPLWLIISGASLTAFLVTYFSMPVIVKVSTYKHIFALPNSRTSHNHPTPNLGGIGIFTGFLISAIIFSFNFDSSFLKYLICGMTLLLFAGLKDDVLILDPKKKISIQIITALIIVIPGNIRISDFHSVLGIGELPYLISVIFTSLFIVYTIISFNFIDGIDGLASGFGIIISLFYGIWFLLSGHITSGILGTSFACSLLAFMRFNLSGKEHKIFMGDAGAMIIGLVISVFTVQFLEYELNAPSNLQFKAAPALSMSLLFIPIADSLRVFIIRAKTGRLFQGGRNHIHHLVLSVCNSHILSTTIIILFNIVLVLFAIVFQGFGNIPLILLMALLTVIFYIVFLMLARKKGTLNNLNSNNQHNTGILSPE